jgi:integrase
MNAATFKLVIRMDKLSKSTNEVPVCLRITKDRKVMYKTLLHIDPKYWNGKEPWIKKQHPNAELLNTQLSQQKAALERETCLVSLTNDSAGVSIIRNKINNRTSFDLFEYAEKHLGELYKEGKYATYKRRKSVIERLQLYVKEDPDTAKSVLPIKSITPDFIRQYENYMLYTINNNRNTVTTNMKILKKLVGDIYRNNNLDENINPFRGKRFKWEQTDRKFLEIEDIKKIEDFKIRLQSPLYDARELFLFECYTGMRISDILSLKWKNVTDTEILISMRKTGKTISIPIIDKAQEILGKRRSILRKNYPQIPSEKYVFEILKIDVENSSSGEEVQEIQNAISCATAIINKKLKRVAQKAGINKNLSTHVARHSFATALITKGADLLIVRDLLGHSDIRVTQIYAKVVSAKKREAMNLLNNL